MKILYFSKANCIARGQGYLEYLRLILCVVAIGVKFGLKFSFLTFMLFFNEHR